ncbi:MAG: RNA polymerase sigma factor [Anaerolineales bacterium]|nr:RNA polymerase sigma factor [Anaerolineales bacterium]
MNSLMKTGSTSPPMDDIQLAQLSRTDSDAFAELYQRHVTRVYRYHMAHVGNVKDAEDLTSQTFIAALESIKSFRGTGSFAAWIFGIAANKKAMFFRSSKPQVELDEALHISSPKLASDRLANQHLQLDSITRALKQLSSDRADAITLIFFGGLSNIEASRVMKKSEASVKMLVSRGLQDLRERTSLRLEVEE